MTLVVNRTEHKNQHVELHENLLLLVADFQRCAPEGTDLSQVSVEQLLAWSGQQQEFPSLPLGYQHEEN